MGALSSPFLPYTEDIAVSLLGAPTYRSRNELRWGRKGSFCVWIGGPHTGRFKDFETGPGGDLLDLVQEKMGCNRASALEWLRSFTGEVRPSVAPLTQSSAAPSQPLVWSTEAQTIWNRSVPLKGTLGEDYLKARKCYVPDVSDLRFLQAGKHPPALVARVTDFVTGAPMTLAFIRLDPQSGRKASGPGAKTCLWGHRKSGGVVRLSRFVEVGGRLGVAEGIETAMTVIAEGHGPVWAALGADNLKRLLPSDRFGELVIWADHDRAGREAADHLGGRWGAAGHGVRIALPPNYDTDWNDVVMTTASEDR